MYPGRIAKMSRKKKKLSWWYKKTLFLKSPRPLATTYNVQVSVLRIFRVEVSTVRRIFRSGRLRWCQGKRVWGYTSGGPACTVFEPGGNSRSFHRHYFRVDSLNLYLYIYYMSKSSFWFLRNLVDVKVWSKEFGQHIEKFFAEKTKRFWKDGIFKLRERLRYEKLCNKMYIESKCKSERTFRASQ